QAFVRVDSHRMGNQLQKGKVVNRITVKVTAIKGMTGCGQPFIQTNHLAFLKAGRAQDLTGVAAIHNLRVGGQDMIHSQVLGYRMGNKAVSRGDDQQIVTIVAVLLQQRLCLDQHQRFNAGGHELLVQLGQLGGGEASQGGEGKALIGMDVQGAIFVRLIKEVVLPAILNGINQLFVNQKFTPTVIAVAGDQGIVEVKDCESHSTPE